MRPNTEQFEFLLCESLIAPRGAAMPEELRKWLASDPNAKSIRNQYLQLNRLLKGWRVLPSKVDFGEAAGKISATIREQRDISVLAELIPHWSGPVPDVDYAALKSRISAAVSREATQGPRQVSDRRVAVKRRRMISWVGRIAAPLAVAAAIAIAVWWPKDVTQTQPGTPQVVQVEPPRPMVLVSLDSPKNSGQVTINFDETADDGGKGGSEKRPGMAAVIWSVETAQASDDDAFLY